MKGLVEKTNTGTIFLNVKHSSICEESKTERAGFQPIEVTNPRTREAITKYVKVYNGVEALVTKIEWYSRDFEDTTFRGWKIHLDAAGTPAILDLPFGSRAAKRFMKLAENIDFTRPVEFRAWHDAKTDSTAFFVGQDGRSIPQAYTMENPGDCPAPVKNRLGKWNFDAQDEYLYNQMVDVVIPRVEAAGNVMPEGERAEAATVGASVRQVARPEYSEAEDSEIPF